MNDQYYMNIALQLAEAVHAQTSPNPPVGAVIVKDGDIVGMGAHLMSGEAHAEIVALQMAKERAVGATMYVTLEPCSHTGKTPPCADAIINHQLQRVVIATADQHEVVAGQGIKQLREANIDVKTGVLEEHATALYRMFFHYVKRRLPYVTLKTAMTLDGKIATTSGSSKWITGEESRADGHRYRHAHDAILVGVGTVLADNPQLTTRFIHGKHPLRVILDSELRTPIDAHVITDGEAATWIFVGKNVPTSRIDMYEEYKQVRIIKMRELQVEVNKVLAFLGEAEITSVYVEGGAQIHGAFLTSAYVDQYITYIAPKLIGGKTATSAIEGVGIDRMTDALQVPIQSVELIGEDIKIVARKEE